MARITFTVDFKGTIEVLQDELKLQEVNENGELVFVDPTNLSPEVIKEGLKQHKMFLAVDQHIQLMDNPFDEVKLKVDYQENPFA